MLRLSCLVVLGVIVAAPLQVLAYGPGVHAREAAVTLEMLAEQHQEWAEAADSELASEYLTIGSMSPDFEYAVDLIYFGHSKGLSYHLLEAAQGMPVQFRLFALGHLTHAGGSDAAAEEFIGPAMFAMAPLGMFDIVVGEDDAQGESEGIFEGLGDLVLGDWHKVGDVLWFFWLEGDEAKERGHEILTWYCEEGSAYSGTSLDCEAVWEELVGFLGQAEGLFGGFDYQGVHDLVDMITSQPLEDLADLVFAGALGSFLEYEVEEGEHTKQEKERLKNSILMDPEFWVFYDSMQFIGPMISVAFYEEKPSAGTWPVWMVTPFKFANIRSVMSFLPDIFSPWPGIIVDDISYHSADGEPVTVINPEEPAAELNARIRLYSVLPFNDDLRGLVRIDKPGSDQAEDDIVGEVVLPLEVDPLEYGSKPRQILTIPFEAAAGDGLGFYVELYLNDEELPWFSTSWDRIWPTGVLPFDWDVYKNNFGTYGHWPPSLPVDGAQETGATLFAKVRVAPFGPGLEGAQVEVDGEVLSTKSNGLALFTGLDSGDYSITADAAGYVLLEDNPMVVTVAVGTTTWTEMMLHAVPQVSLPPEWSNGECGEVAWEVLPFAGQAKNFMAEVVLTDNIDSPIVQLTTNGGVIVLCPEDLPRDVEMKVAVVPFYQDNSPGVRGWSEPFMFESEPVVEVVEFVEVLEPQVEWEDLLEEDLGKAEVITEIIYDLAQPDMQIEPGAEIVDSAPDEPAGKSSGGCAMTGPGSVEFELFILLLLALFNMRVLLRRGSVRAIWRSVCDA